MLCYNTVNDSRLISAIEGLRTMIVTQQDGRTPDEAQQVLRFKELTERLLPALAKEHGWPIRLDHCFKRICLDHAFGDIWYKHLPKPAERHLAGEPLLRALACAEEIASEGLPLLRQRDAASLRVRGKRPKPR